MCRDEGSFCDENLMKIWWFGFIKKSDYLVLHLYKTKGPPSQMQCFLGNWCEDKTKEINLEMVSMRWSRVQNELWMLMKAVEPAKSIMLLEEFQMSRQRDLRSLYTLLGSMCLCTHTHEKAVHTRTRTQVVCVCVHTYVMAVTTGGWRLQLQIVQTFRRITFQSLCQHLQALLVCIHARGCARVDVCVRRSVG